MLVNCANGAISASVVTHRHALLAPSLQTAGQIELDVNSIRFALLNRYESIIPSPSTNNYVACSVAAAH